MRCLLLLLLVACASAPVVSTPSEIPGTWSRELPAGERQRLVLFEGGVFGFQHVGPEQPIARAYGWWSRDGSGPVQLEVVGVEPESERFAEPIDLAAWTFVGAPTIKDERDWTYLVARATRGGH